MECVVSRHPQIARAADALVIPAASRGHWCHSPIQNSSRRRSFRFRLGDGTHRPLHRAGRRLQQSLRRPHPGFRLGTAALSVFHGRSVQSLRRLFLRLGMGAADVQQFALGAHLHPDLSHRRSSVRGSHRAVVGTNLGLAAVDLVLVDSLALGHYVHPAHPQPDFSDRV